MTTLRKRVGAAAAVAALIAVGLPGLVSTAAAAPALAPSNIDPDARGSLTVTSLARAGADGSSEAVAGVTFTIQPVLAGDGGPIDLGTPQGWTAIEGTTADEVTDDILGAGQAVTTGADGTATFDDLALGLYYVTETGSPENVAVRTAPFLVTIPSPDEGAGTWNYDVAASPKNSLATASQEVDDAAALTLGDTVTWTLTGSIPVGPDGAPLSQYTVTNELDDRLSYVADSLELTTTPGLDLGTADYTAGVADGLLTVDFTPAGLAKLADIASVEAQLTVLFDTEVTAIGDGEIVNEAQFSIGEAQFRPAQATEWGAVEILMHVEGAEDAPLAGAVFEVYKSAEDARNGTDPIAIQVEGQPVAQFETGADGQVLLPGFLAGKTIYLTEVQAPAGYTASEEVHEITVATGSLESPKQVKLTNLQREGVDLPVLGADGMVVAGLVGLGLIAAGVVLAVASKRRKAVN